MLFALLLSLTAYTYNHHDWLNMPAMDRVISITADNFDVYVAVTRGIYVIEKGDRKLKRTITHSDGVRGEVRAAGYDSEIGSLWVLSSENLLSVDPFTNVSFTFDLPHFGISALGIGQGYLYLPYGERTYRMDKRTGQVDDEPPGSRRIAWYGTKSPYEPEDYPFLTPYLYRDRQLNAHPITCVFPEGRKLWVGTEGYGLYLYSLATKQPMAYWRLGPAGEQVQQIFRLQEGIWFAGEDELARYDSQQDTWSYFPTPFNVWYPDSALLLRSKILDLRRREQILSIAGDTSGFLIGTEYSIYSYQPTGNVLAKQFKLNFPANYMQMSEDSVFIGTDNGLIRYDRRLKTWSLFNDTLQQMHFGVFGIAATERHRYYGVYGGLETQDSAGNWVLVTPPGFDLSAHPTTLAAYGAKLFVGTNQGLIVLNEKNGGYTTLNRDNGLLANRIESMYADENYLWIATNAGISRFDHRALFP